MLDKFYKLIWFFRAFFASFLFGSFRLPGYLGRPIFLMGVRGIFIDERVRIFPLARIEVFSGGRLEISRNVAIAQSVHITCKNLVSIGEGACIAANVCITDISHQYFDKDKNILEQEDKIKKTVIGRNCFIGYGAVIDAGTELGDGCIVGANAYVKGIFPSYSVIASEPARVIRNYA